MKYANLYAIAEGSNTELEPVDMSTITLDEAVAMFQDQFLCETYYGRSAVDPILEAMKKCVQTVKGNPNIWLRNSKANKELEAAICKVFGFKKTTIYWTDPMATNCTLPASVITNRKQKESSNKGWSKKGYFDMDHTIFLAVELDQRMITKGDLTAEELVAILLHEIGHNFDFSNWAFLDEVFRIIKQVVTAFEIDNAIKLFPYMPDEMKAQARSSNWSTFGVGMIIRAITSTEIGRKIYFEVMSIPTTLTHVMPKTIRDGLMKVVHVVEDIKIIFDDIKYGLLDAGKMIGTAISNPVSFIIGRPFYAVCRFMTFKTEQFADSFATSYGYGPEMASGLKKIANMSHEVKWFTGPIANILYNLNYIRSEVIDMIRRDHGSNMQRSVYAIRYLNEEMKKADLSAEEKAAINDEIKRMAEMATKLSKMDDDRRYAAAALFNQAVYAVIKDLPNLTPGNYVK